MREQESFLASQTYTNTHIFAPVNGNLISPNRRSLLLLLFEKSYLGRTVTGAAFIRINP